MSTPNAAKSITSTKPRKSARRKPHFSPVTGARPADEIQAQIRKLFSKGRIVPGDRLPSERELAEQFAVSRNSVRQALRSLADGGLLEIRKGAAGGAFVRTDGGGAVSSLFTDLYSLGTVQPSHLTEVRVLVGTEAIRLACERGTREQFEELEQNVAAAWDAARREDFEQRTVLNLEFYRIIARMSQNPLLEILTDGILSVTHRVVQEYARIPNAVLMPFRTKLLDLMRAKKKEEAAALVRDHLLKLQKLYLIEVAAHKARAR